MSQDSYHQFCPVAMAAEVLCKRWTMLLVRELVAGSTRFNDLRRGVPRMSPTLLSQRLKELEAAGVLMREPAPGEPAISEYRLTPAGEDLAPVVQAMGAWGQRWIEASVSLRNLDASLLMWDMRRNLDPAPLPRRRVTVRFRYPELPASRRDYWLVVEPDGAVDLCAADPGFEVDLFVTTDLRTMTAVWMGLETLEQAGMKIALDGSRELAATMRRWLGFSVFAREPKLAG
ncbi:winged helix-turn-helix transcriptional regulator [Limimaricola pyoseonensis]|uniref:DNA-binding transcriptional regulator, HxlR family n=1 Tax=Limimaricola pyoseonensis TaxID=521013 RepID=A0A1G7GZA1_9RHOB|nr:helix-turn-helix domain-containing protein [Limimaricola pyoseonensis]SDE93259.1 DNA-binding transcriptional regulator, HxlR family [Limimaricola pyoseonensis]